jgi:hypothetical protein
VKFFFFFSFLLSLKTEVAAFAQHINAILVPLSRKRTYEKAKESLSSQTLLLLANINTRRSLSPQTKEDPIVKYSVLLVK